MMRYGVLGKNRRRVLLRRPTCVHLCTPHLSSRDRLYVAFNFPDFGVGLVSLSAVLVMYSSVSEFSLSCRSAQASFLLESPLVSGAWNLQYKYILLRVGKKRREGCVYVCRDPAMTVYCRHKSRDRSPSSLPATKRRFCGYTRPPLAKKRFFNIDIDDDSAQAFRSCRPPSS